MNNPLYEELHAEGIISDQTLQNLRNKYANPLFSLHWELKTLLYLGVMLLSTGLGILIYKNIDSISHQVVLLAIAAISSGCFYWCLKNKMPYSNTKVLAPNSFFDYILLLGTLSFLTFVGYLQFQFEVFGTHFGLATFIPMLVLFFVAYYFDHLGILTMAIANLAIWMGVSVTPKHLLQDADFASERIIYTYLILGLCLLAGGYLTKRYKIKPHFFFSYHHYGVHLTFISVLAGFFFYDLAPAMLWIAGFAVAGWFIFQDAKKSKSFYFLLLTALYSYVAISGLVVRLLIKTDGDGIIYLGFMYFITSAIGFTSILINLNKSVKASSI